MVETKLIELVSFTVLEYENSLNPFLVNQQSRARYLKLANIKILLDEEIRIRGEQLEWEENKLTSCTNKN